MTEVCSVEQYEEMKKRSNKKLFIAMYGKLTQDSIQQVQYIQYIMKQLDMNYGRYANFVFVDIGQIKPDDANGTLDNYYTYKIFAEGKLLEQTIDYNRVCRLCTKYGDKISFNMVANY